MAIQRLSGVFWMHVLGPGQEAMGGGIGIYLRAEILEAEQC